MPRFFAADEIVRAFENINSIDSVVRFSATVVCLFTFCSVSGVFSRCEFVVETAGPKCNCSNEDVLTVALIESGTLGTSLRQIGNDRRKTGAK